jgi:putative methionine-R-sulfoxide reductase with GAF domain
VRGDPPGAYRDIPFQNSVCIRPISGDNTQNPLDRYSILDQTSSGSAPGVPPPVSSAAKEEFLPPPPSQLSADAGSKSLMEMARRDLEAALQLLAERAQYITGASGAAIALREGSAMICRASAGPSAPELGAEVQIKSGLTGESVRTRKVLRCDDAETDSRVNRESCRALGIKSVMVVPLLREQEVTGVFELLADRANAFEERDVTALERLAEMVQTGLEHADAAKRALQEIAAKNAQATAQQAAQQKEPKPPETAPAPAPAEIELAKIDSVQIKKDASVVVASAPKTSDTKTPKLDAPAPVRAPELDKIRKCEACGFPVSEGRTLCLDCEAARLSGESPAPLASNQAPAFLAKFETRKEQGWLGSHIYTIGTVLIVILTVVLLVLRLR